MGCSACPSSSCATSSTRPPTSSSGSAEAGLPDSVMRWPSVERFIRGPAHRPGTGLIERTMRIAATDISRRAFIHFIRERAEDRTQANFVFPGVVSKDTVISQGRGGIGPA